MRKKILFIGIISAFSGCGERIMKQMKRENFEINGNHYINYKCGFEIAIPTNWAFAIDKTQIEGIDILILFKDVLTHEKRGEVMLYYVYQKGGESSKDLFERKVQRLIEERELDKERMQHLENYKNERFLILEEFETHSILISNSNTVYEWFFTKQYYKEIDVDENRRRNLFIYFYDYFIPCRDLKNVYYHLPLAMVFGKCDGGDLIEKDYLQNQMQVLHSFRTFSNFVRNALPNFFLSTSFLKVEKVKVNERRGIRTFFIIGYPVLWNCITAKYDFHFMRFVE